MTSSATPSPKNSCSGSVLMFVKGSTATEGLSGKARAGWTTLSIARPAAPVTRTRYTLTGLAMFFSCCPPYPRSKLEFPGGVFLNAGRNADSARLGQSFQPGRDVDAITKDIAVLDYDIALMNTDPVFNASVWGNVCVPLGHIALHFAGTPQCINDTGELDEHSVACRLN